VNGNGFYGPNKTIDTQHKFTVVTQFHTSNGTDLGELVEIRQFFVQHGVLIPQQGLRLPGQDFFDSINKSFCESVTTRSENEFQNRGGMEAISRAMDQGLVLVMGIWTGEVTNTLGSIQKVPATRRASLRTINEGICPRETRTQPFVQKHYPHASVKFSNLRIEPINSSWVGLTQHHPVPAHEHKVL
jgi:cellulose 1,4-beta-cellobiosidase